MSYCGGCSYQAGIQSSYTPGSGLEMAVQEYQPVMRMSEETKTIEHFEMPVKSYSSKDYSSGLYLVSKQQMQYFTPEPFLKDVPTEFISSEDENQNEEVMALVDEAFEKATGKSFPKDISIKICSPKELKEAHDAFGGKWSAGIKGFSINRKGFGMNQVFVKEEELARLMLTLGHEIGHVLTFTMKESVDEEAKAFAFSMTWMKAIADNNIGGLYSAINPMPARNGLHNVAFDLIIEQMQNGKTAEEVYSELIKGEISINNRIPVF